MTHQTQLDDKLVQSIAELARQGQQPQTVLEDSGRLVFILANGEVHTAFKTPHDRAHEVRTVGDLVDAATLWGNVEPTDDTELDQGERGVLWHDNNACVLIVRDDDRRERVTLKLPNSEPLLLLMSLEQRGSIPHRDFVRFLRIDLRGVVPEGIAQAIASIEIHSQGAKASQVERGRERGTAEFRRELQNAVDIPEVFPATLSLYNVADLRDNLKTIEMSFEIDLETCACRAAIMPGQLERAVESTQNDIAARLGEVGLPVLYGAP